MEKKHATGKNGSSSLAASNSSVALPLPESRAWCKALAKREAGNFYYSFLTLPASQLEDMCVLYAFMRVSDDLGDDVSQSIDQKTSALKAWEADFEAALQGETVSHPVFPALMELIARYAIPHKYFSAVIEGVMMDMQPVVFSTFEELERYCYHVAGAVGLCCIHIWGFHDDRALDAAIDCGLAFQLTNILRDLGEDAGMGRVYLPMEDLERFGYFVEDLSAETQNSSFHKLMKFEVDRARNYYKKAERLFDYLDPAGQPILSAMMKIYRGLLEKIERRNYDVFSSRVKLPAWKKLGIAMQAMLKKRLLSLKK